MADDGDAERALGQRIRALRAAAGWSQQRLAEELKAYGCDFHQTTIAKLEAGTRPTRINEAATLARVFGLSLSALLNGDAPEASLLERAIRERIAAEILAKADVGIHAASPGSSSSSGVLQ